MRIARTFLIVLAASASLAAADLETQSFDYAWDYLGEDEFQSFAQFDTQGGTRELNNVSLTMEGIYSFSFIFENSDPNPLNAGDYNPSPLVLGGISPLNADLFLSSIASDYQPLQPVDLAAGDGNSGTGPDSAFYGVEGSLSGTANLIASDFAAVTGNGNILFEYLFFPQVELPEGWFAGVQFVDHAHYGTFTVTYDYSVVPAPATGTLAAMGLVAFARRRRA